MSESPTPGSLRDGLPFAALREALKAGYGLADLRADLLAGLTVGVVAVPLAMALAIAINVPPQHGLYTAIFAGFLIALTGGSRYNVSGPTAAFVVILIPVVQQHGLGGLLVATMMAGVLLVAMGVTGLGRMVQFIPYPVVVGFTAGIAVVIATLQLKDLLGLAVEGFHEHYLDNLWAIFGALGTFQWEEALMGALTLGILIGWRRVSTAIPGHLVALASVGVVAWLASRWVPGIDIQTIASRFEYVRDGEVLHGIPPMLPALQWPWTFPGPDGRPLDIDFALIRALIGPAFAIAILGAIESLLCAVVADGLTGTRHRSNSELIGQGIGNIVAPLFGGITATAAIARTATAIRAGARSPIAAIVHALVVLGAVTVAAGVLSHLPMAALAALLVMVAWNMSEAKHFTHILRAAPRSDVAVLLVCFVLTVIFDMVLAVAVGIGLAAALFIGHMSALTGTRRLAGGGAGYCADLPPGVVVYDVNGPLFFGVADRAISTLREIDHTVRVVIIDMRDVPSMDMTAIVSLQALIADMGRKRVALIFSNLPTHIIVKLRRAGVRKHAGRLTYCADPYEACRVARRWVGPDSEAPAEA